MLVQSIVLVLNRTSYALNAYTVYCYSLKQNELLPEFLYILFSLKQNELLPECLCSLFSLKQNELLLEHLYIITKQGS